MATGTTNKPLVKMVNVSAEAQTIGNNERREFRIEYSENGYRCFPIEINEYRSSAGWYTHTKGIAEGVITFDYMNNTGAEISAKPYANFLCFSM